MQPVEQASEPRLARRPLPLHSHVTNIELIAAGTSILNMTGYDKQPAACREGPVLSLTNVCLMSIIVNVSGCNATEVSNVESVPNGFPCDAPVFVGSLTGESTGDAASTQVLTSAPTQRPTHYRCAPPYQRAHQRCNQWHLFAPPTKQPVPPCKRTPQLLLPYGAKVTWSTSP
jgi:hypothetical protein